MSIGSDAKRNAEIQAEANRLGLQAWQLEAARAVGTDLIADIVRDHRRGVHQVSSPLASTPDPRVITEPVGVITSGPVNRGWVDAAPLPDSPPGYQHIDRMMNAQDARDRAERVAELARRGVQSNGKP